MDKHPAMLWEPAEGQKVRCGLCQHRCLIAPGRRGLCGVRENEGGTLYSLVYGRSVAQAVDPVEKKPLYHFLPGSRTFSVATLGCNFHCLHCQNAHISQIPGEEMLLNFGEELSPQQIVAEARASGCASIAYTYTEPTIFFEYALQTAQLARAAGLRNVFVTNGYITPEALRLVQPWLDAANIDLKFWQDEQYRQVCGARLQPVLDSARLYRELGIWIEITTLIIPGYNDGEEDLRGIARFVAGELGPDVPWHISRFHPAHRMLRAPVTPLATLEQAQRIGREAGLKYVYLGNARELSSLDTLCPSCATPVLRRQGMRLVASQLRQGGCPGCGTPLAGIWE